MVHGRMGAQCRTHAVAAWSRRQPETTAAQLPAQDAGNQDTPNQDNKDAGQTRMDWRYNQDAGCTMMDFRLNQVGGLTMMECKKGKIWNKRNDVYMDCG